MRLIVAAKGVLIHVCYTLTMPRSWTVCGAIELEANCVQWSKAGDATCPTCLSLVKDAQTASSEELGTVSEIYGRNVPRETMRGSDG